MLTNNGEITQIFSVNELEYILGVSRNELLELCDTCYLYYHPYYKKNGKKKRKIDNPKGSLKKIQKNISNSILVTAKLPEGFFGFVKGKSYILNSDFHKGQEVVVSIDIKDFFPSVTDKEVFDIFKYYFCFSTYISSILTRLTTYNYRLPQGASSSGYLANLSLLPVYRELMVLSSTYSLKLSFYADDITFSGSISKMDSTKLIKDTLLILKKYGFRSKNKKIAVMHKSKRQCVTGLMVNNKRLSIPPKKLAECRAKISDDKRSSQSKEGIIRFVKMINPKQVKHL